MISSIEIHGSFSGHQAFLNPDRGIKFKIRILRASVFILLFMWCAGFLLISLFPENKAILVFYPLLKKIYSGFCHQDPVKSIFIGQYFLVCARCSGIYIGALIIAFFSIFVSTNEKKFSVNVCLVSLVPMLTDIILYNIKFYSYSITAAFFTGMVFGSAAIILILSLIENNLFYNNKGCN